MERGAEAPPPLLLPRDRRQVLALSQRRHAELRRQGRVFNARDRVLGGDPAAWDIQVREQKIREATERARDETFAAETRHHDKILCTLELREEEDEKNACRAVDDFRRDHQRPETRRESDLSEPPAPASGLRAFLGEDPNCRARERFQAEQTRHWLLQQQREALDARACRERAEDRYVQAQLQFEAAARLLDEQQRDTRKAVCVAVKEFNKSQVAELAARRAQERQREEEDNAAEMNHLLSWTLLTEASPGGPRPQPHRWKGLSAEERASVRGEQELQVQEKLRLREQEGQRARAWERQQVQEARDSLLEQRRQRREQREARRALDRSNLGLAEEHRQREKAMKEASTNHHSEDYFSQFNTSSR